MKNAKFPANGSKISMPIRSLIAGLLIAVLLCFSLYYLAADFVHDFLALLLAATAGIYLIPAYNTKNTGIIIFETLIFIFIFLVAVFGLYYSPLILGAGFVLHALCNFFHWPFPAGVNVGKAFPSFCLIFNLTIALFIFIFWS